MYEGEWKAGICEGRGTYLYADGSGGHDGEWKGDEKRGRGTYRYANGAVEVGFYKAGKDVGDGVVERRLPDSTLDGKDGGGVARGGVSLVKQQPLPELAYEARNAEGLILHGDGIDGQARARGQMYRWQQRRAMVAMRLPPLVRTRHREDLLLSAEIKIKRRRDSEEAQKRRQADVLATGRRRRRVLLRPRRNYRGGGRAIAPPSSPSSSKNKKKKNKKKKGGGGGAGNGLTTRRRRPMTTRMRMRLVTAAMEQLDVREEEEADNGAPNATRTRRRSTHRLSTRRLSTRLKHGSTRLGTRSCYSCSSSCTYSLRPSRSCAWARAAVGVVGVAAVALAG